MKTNKTKVGLNILSNRLSIINGLIPLSWQGIHADFNNIYDVSMKTYVLPKLKHDYANQKLTAYYFFNVFSNRYFEINIL